MGRGDNQRPGAAEAGIHDLISQLILEQGDIKSKERPKNMRKTVGGREKTGVENKKKYGYNVK